MVKLLEKVACMRLHTAGLVIGWLGLIGSVLGVILSAYVLGNVDVFADYLIKNFHSHSNTSHDEIRVVIVTYSSIYLGAALIAGFISGLLIFGTKKNRHLMILPWLILHGIGVVINIISLIGAAVAMFQGGSILQFFLDVLAFVIYVYLYWGIYSLYKHIQIQKVTGHAM